MTTPLCWSTVASISHPAVIEALGWALVHFVWQATAIALALVGFLAFARRSSPQCRYTAGCAALSLMALGACSTFVRHLVIAERQDVLETAVAPSIDSPRPSSEPEPIVVKAVFDRTAVSPQNAATIPHPHDEGKIQSPGIETARAFTPIAVERRDSGARLLEEWTDRLRPGLPWLVALWGTGVALLSLRLAHGWRTVRRLRASAEDLADPVWAERFTRLRERLDISYPVRLLSSAGARVPMVIGSLKPVVLVPACMLTGLSTEQIEALLVHELAHISRHDYLVNLLQNVLETLFFYHPAVWWVSGQIRKEREHCCDDVAAAACGTVGYARALASLAELRQASPGFGLAANGTPLVERIRRLAGVAPASGRSAGWLAIAALVALVTAVSLRPVDRSRADAKDTKTVKGTVICHGRPLADAEVIAEGQHRRCGPARTNGQGQFELQVPIGIVIEYRVSLPHSFVVSVALDKRAPLALCFHRFVAPAKVEKKEPLILKVEWPYAWGGYWPPSEGKTSQQTTTPGKSVRRIAGKVVDHEGKPIAGARLWWMVHDDSPNKRFRTVAECASDANGHFRIEALFEPNAPRWTLGQLWVLAEGRNWTVDDAPQMIDRLAAKGRELVIRLEPASDFEFQVNDADGRPVPGAVIENNWGYFHAAKLAGCGADVHPIEPEIPAAVRALWRTTADASGRAHLRSLRDVFDIKVTSREFGTQVFRLPQDERTSKRTIRLRQTGRVEGRVVADDPRSVGGIKIWLRTWMSPELSITARWAGIEGTDFVTTDAAGRFSVPAIAEGELILRVLDWPGSSTLLPRIPQGLSVTAGKTTRAEIRLEPSVPVEGVVQTKDRGQPVAGVRITLRPFDSDSSIDLTSDANGRYQAHVLPGSLWMSSMIPDEIAARYVQSPFHSMQSPFPFYVSLSPQQVRVKPTPNGQPFQLPATVLIPAKSVKGTVIDANGKPLAHAAVHGDAREGRYWASTDLGGAFELRVPQWVTVDAYDVALPFRLVTDVTIDKREPLVLMVKSISASGGYEFSRRKQPTSQDQGAEAAKRAARAAASTPSVRKIAGRVVDHDGKPVPKAYLWWVVIGDFFKAREYTIKSTTDAAGRFEMQAPANWKPRPPESRPTDTLWILAPGMDLKVVDARDGLIEAGKASALVVRLDPAISTEYQVRDSHGGPVIGALVEPWHFRTLGHRYDYLPDAIRELLRAATDPSGRVRLPSLPRQDLHDVQVTASGLGIQLLQLNGPDMQAAHRTITLREAGRVEGRILSENPLAFRGVKMLIETMEAPGKTVQRRLGSGKIEYAQIRETEGTALVTSDDSGRFVVPEIAAGPAMIMFIDEPAKPVLLPRIPAHLQVTAGHTAHRNANGTLGGRPRYGAH
jgi:protocatechuate 3,4-dioxygenase beta subunit